MSTTSGKHIMFSYAWQGGHQKVDQIAMEFRSAGIPIWMDTRNGFGEDVIDGMAEAVEDSLAVCCFVTPEYQESKYCEMELKYAIELNIPIIPCFLTDFKPRKWLGLLTAGRIRYDFSGEVKDAILNPLIRYIKQDILKVKPNVPAKAKPKPIKKISQSVSPEERDVQKTAVGTVDSDEEQSTSNNDSSRGVSPINTLTPPSRHNARKSSASDIRSDMFNLAVNQTHQRHVPPTASTNPQRSRTNGSQNSQRYKQY